METIRSDRAAIMARFPRTRMDAKEKITIILDLIDQKLSEGRTNLIVSYSANKDFYEERSLTYFSWKRAMAKLREVTIIYSVKKAVKGEAYEEYRINYDFVVFPKNERVLRNARDAYFAFMEKYGSSSGSYAAWLEAKARVYAKGHKRATLARMLEEVDI